MIIEMIIGLSQVENGELLNAKKIDGRSELATDSRADQSLFQGQELEYLDQLIDI